MNLALRAGVTGGVMGTIALTTAAAPSSAAGNQAPAETAEMPALSEDLSTSAAQAAESMESSALRYEILDAQQTAAEKAREKAAETKKKAVAKARAEAREKAEKAREKARALEARADRGTDGGGRTDLGDAVSDVLPGSGNAASVVEFAKQQVGKAYVMGATGPSSYDCSGLTGAALKQAGVELPRTSQDQSTAGTAVGMDSLQAGDLLYWGNAGEAYHVAIYVGDGKYIGAQNSETGVVERDLSYDPPTGAVRVL